MGAAVSSGVAAPAEWQFGTSEGERRKLQECEDRIKLAESFIDPAVDSDDEKPEHLLRVLGSECPSLREEESSSSEVKATFSRQRKALSRMKSLFKKGSKEGACDTDEKTQVQCPESKVKKSVECDAETVAGKPASNNQAEKFDSSKIKVEVFDAETESAASLAVSSKEPLKVRKGLIGVDLSLSPTRKMFFAQLPSPTPPPGSPLFPERNQNPGKFSDECDRLQAFDSEFGIGSPIQFSPTSPLELDGPRYKGFSLLPVGNTCNGESGYYATRPQASKWQYWTFDFLNGWTQVADKLSPRKCTEEAAMTMRNTCLADDDQGLGSDLFSKSVADHNQLCNELMRDFDMDQPASDGGKTLFNLIPMFNTGDHSVDALVDSNLNDRNLELEARDSSGNSLIIHAAECNKPSLVRRLLQKGASANWKNSLGFCALHYAVYDTSANFYSAKALLEHGAQPDLADQSGCTPLHYAACEGRVAILALLLFHKARADLFDANGFTPLRYAEENGCKKCAALLRATNESLNEWASCTDQETSLTYYYNQRTGQTSWEEPRGCMVEPKNSKADNKDLQTQIMDAMKELEIQERGATYVPLGSPSPNGTDGKEMITKAQNVTCLDEITKMMEELMRENDELKKQVGSANKSNGRSRKGKNRSSKASSLSVKCRLRRPTGEACNDRIALSISGRCSLSFVKQASKTYAKDITCYERAFDQGSDSAEIYRDAIKPLLVETVLSKNSAASAVAIFCGAHSSGKTYTLFGDGPKKQGVVYHAAENMFGSACAEGANVTRLAVTQIEVTSDGCFDLLSGSKKLSQQWNRSTLACDLGAEARDAHSAQEVVQIVSKGYEQRELFSSFITVEGCQSHLVTTLSLRSEAKEQPVSLTFVELASFGTSKYVNQSSRSLGRVLKALKRKDREAARDALEDNELGQILGQSLVSKGSKTLLMATLCPWGKAANCTDKVLHFSKHFS